MTTLESQRAQFAAGLTACAEQLRNCAQMADTFAKLLNTSVDDHNAQPNASIKIDEHAKGKRKAALSPDDDDSKKKRKRVTKPKDPNAPKRPASSYIIFQNEVRKELKEQHPSISNSELLAMISEQWKNMSEDQKETYNQAMKTLKIQYSEEKKAYDNRSPEEIEAANNAVAAAAATKKASKAPRGTKTTTAVPVPAAVQARPPPLPQVESYRSESEEDESDEEDVKLQTKHIESSEVETDSSDESLPAPKRKRGSSAQPQPQKGKKGSKA